MSVVNHNYDDAFWGHDFQQLVDGLDGCLRNGDDVFIAAGQISEIEYRTGNFAEVQRRDVFCDVFMSGMEQCDLILQIIFAKLRLDRKSVV